MPGVRIYRDVCCLNRPFDDQREERVRLEAEAILTILRRVEAGIWNLVGGDMVDFETGRMPDLERRQRVSALANLASTKLPVDQAAKVRAQMWIEQGLKPADALHLASAEGARVDAFLTTDDQMLRAIRRAGLATVRVNNPLPWLNEVLS
jgi:predicted nucleic acid-binding protein